MCGNYLQKKGDAILFQINLQTYKKDTFIINLNKSAFYYQNTNDFSVWNNKLYLLNGGIVYIYDIFTNSYYCRNLPVKIKSKYQHFSIKDSNNIYLFDWGIGLKIKEEKNVIEYNFYTEQIKQISEYEVNALHFLATDLSKRYVDINNNSLVTFNPDKYEIHYLDLVSGKSSILKRELDTSDFIQRSVLENLNNQYFIKPTYAILDSLTNYEINKTQLNGIKIWGDSLIFVSFQNVAPKCKYNNSNILDYLDIWKYNSQLATWYLYKSDLKLNNEPICKSVAFLELNKTRLPFSSVNNWDVSNNKLILSTMISTKIDLESSEMPKQLYNRDFYSKDKFSYIIIYKID